MSKTKDYRPEIIGQMYSALTTKEIPGTFSMTLQLKEPIDPVFLQRALDDLVKRLPFINVDLKKGFFWFYHKQRDDKLLIETPDNPRQASFRVIHDNDHVTLEIMHMVTDGRGASKIFTAFFIRYFELKGADISKAGYIDCDEPLDPEEIEDAYSRYYDKKVKKGNPRVKNAFKSDSPKLGHMQLATHRFDLEELKAKAQKYEATVNEYILACIFKATAELKANQPDNKTAAHPVTALMPFDCRGYFRSKTLHNFTSGIHILAPQSDDMHEMVAHVRKNFERINKGWIQRDICLLKKMFVFMNFIPLVFKKGILRMFEKVNASCTSFMFSNVGRVKMPRELENKIVTMDLAMKCNPSPPHAFISATLGNTLSLSIKSVVNDPEMFQRTVDTILGG